MLRTCICLLLGYLSTVLLHFSLYVLHLLMGSNELFSYVLYEGKISHCTYRGVKKGRVGADVFCMMRSQWPGSFENYINGLCIGVVS